MPDTTPLDPTARELAALHAARAPRWRLEPDHPDASTIPGPVLCHDLAVAGALLGDYSEREPLAAWRLLDTAQAAPTVDLAAVLELALAGEDNAALFPQADGVCRVIDGEFDLEAVAVAFLAMLGGDR